MKPKNHKTIALIPARAGSKRLINKNLLLLSGKPLIAWTIDAALNCPAIDRVVVSTDSVDIKNVSTEFGAEVPFMRPGSLGRDKSTTDEVIMHAIEELNLSPDDILVLLQPTSPLRDAEDINSVLIEFNDLTVEGVVTVCECEHSPMWSNILAEDRKMGDFIKPDLVNKRSQDLPVFYRLNGAIYAYRVTYLIKHKSRFYSDKIKAGIMSTCKSVDIDSQLDFNFAEFLIQQNY